MVIIIADAQYIRYHYQVATMQHRPIKTADACIFKYCSSMLENRFTLRVSVCMKPSSLFMTGNTIKSQENCNPIYKMIATVEINNLKFN